MGPIRKALAFGASASAILLAGSAAAQTTASFTTTYEGQGLLATTCNTSFAIDGEEPAASGHFPVFLYMVGTTENFSNASAVAAVHGMAMRGYVSASIQYDSAEFGNCGQIGGKAQCIFNPNSSTSAVAALCSRTKADCSKGIVVGGFSQGAVIGTLAKNFDARVDAVWGMGDGVMYAATDLHACMANGNRVLPSDRLRAVNGQGDEFTGNTQPTQQANMQALTGFTCPEGSFTCLQRNGSGWIIVQNAETESDNADHCYMRDGGCLASQNSLDPGWESGGADWEINANLDWLTRFTAH